MSDTTWVSKCSPEVSGIASGRVKDVLISVSFVSLDKMCIRDRYGSRIKVQDGAELGAGDELTEGSVNPHDILKIKGLRAVQDYICLLYTSRCV